MPLLSPKLRSTDDGALYFWCPACHDLHGVYVGDGPAQWRWNRDAKRPTFWPDIVVRRRDPRPKPNGSPWGTTMNLCHFTLTEGWLHFHKECTHALAGRDVFLPDLPRWLQ